MRSEPMCSSVRSSTALSPAGASTGCNVTRTCSRMISAARRVKLEAGIERWQSLPETKRAEITKRFGQFFDLTPKEKEKALRTLSDAERQQMEKTLRSFEKLPRDQRVQCVRAFEKFAGMSLDERQQFLKNAERWRAMSPGERQSWRDLVGKVPQWPPMPPGFGVPAGKLPAPPPLPPGISVPMATNRG